MDIPWWRLPCVIADRRISSEGANVSKQFYLTEPPAADLTGEKKYSEIQSMLDFTAPAGLNYYFKCPFLCELTDEAIRAIVEAARVFATGTDTGDSRTHARRGKSSSGHRNCLRPATHPLQHQRYGRMESMSLWQRNASIGRGSFASLLEGFGASDGYVNYLGDEGPAAVRASYGANYGRLAELKKKFDPDNFFQFNQNILPAP